MLYLISPSFYITELSGCTIGGGRYKPGGANSQTRKYFYDKNLNPMEHS